MSINSSSQAARSPTEDLIPLESSDGVILWVVESATLHSEIIKAAVAEKPPRSPIHLKDVDCYALAQISRYLFEVCERGGSADAYAKTLSSNKDRMFGVIMAAKSLKIEPLYELLCQTVADMMIGKTPEEIRSFLNIDVPTTPEELRQVEGEMGFIMGPDDPVEEEVSTEQEKVRPKKQLIGPAEGEDEWSYRARMQEKKRQVTKERRERMRAASSQQGATL